MGVVAVGFDSSFACRAASGAFAIVGSACASSMDVFSDSAGETVDAPPIFESAETVDGEAAELEAVVGRTVTVVEGAAVEDVVGGTVAAGAAGAPTHDAVGLEPGIGISGCGCCGGGRLVHDGAR